MSKTQEIWDAAHPVKIGQVLTGGTEFIVARDVLGGIVTAGTLDAVDTDGSLPVDSYGEMFIRTIEPLPDTEDTGDIDFFVYDEKYGTVDIGDTEITYQQARNFARKLMEALNE